MMRFRSISLMLVLALLITSIVSGFAPQRSNAVSGNGDIARGIVATRYGIPIEQLSVVGEVAAEYPLSLPGQQINLFKILDTVAGDVYPIALDGSGSEVDQMMLETNEQSAYFATYGRLDPRLYTHLQTAQPSELIPVVVYAATPGDMLSDTRPASDGTYSDTDLETWATGNDSARASAVTTIVGPVMARLQGMNYTPEADQYTPAIFVTMTAADIQMANSWPDVERIYEEPNGEDELDIARQVIGANTVNGRGITGAGVKLGQVEVGGRVAVVNPNLAGKVAQDPQFVCAAASGHSTAVAGIMVSQHATVRGIAPGATLYAGGSCGGIWNELRAKSTAAGNWGARGLNLSWGANIGLVPGAMDRFYEDMVAYRAITTVKSAGNEAGPCRSGTGNVSSPGLGYNLITVGNFDDKNTVGWADDVMDVCSSFVDPTSWHKDRQKPEVAAPGSYINSTTTANPWTGPVGSGTSYSAPMVTGTAGLLMQRRNTLKVWPESVKSILMASAIHNIEGATRLSNKDGAGGIFADRADVTANANKWGGQFYPMGSPLNIDKLIWLNANQTARVVIAWDTMSNYAQYVNQPSLDLDLYILNPAGAFVAWSVSWDNTYEIVEFTPQVAGWYKLRTHKFRANSNTWLGWAWHQ